MAFNYTDFLQLMGLYFWPFVRISGMLLIVPLFSGRYLDMKSRLTLAVLITLAVAPSLALPEPIDPFTWHGILLVAQQLSIGFAIGLIFNLVFEAFVVAGHLVSMGMGLAMASMVDPSTGVNTPVIGRYYLIIVSLVFLLMNGHILVFKAVLDSFEYMPIGLFHFSDISLQAIVNFASKMFEMGVLTALPIVTALLLVNVSLGVVARAAPSLNVFAIGFAITTLLGFFLLILVTPLILPNLQFLLNDALILIGSLRLNE